MYSNSCKLFLIVSVIFTLLSASSAAQSNSKTNTNPFKGAAFKDRLFYGGDFGLSFGDVTYVRVAPLVGYHVSPKFGFGLGPSYQYWKIKYTGNNAGPVAETSIWGGSTFMRFFPVDFIFLQTDFELLNLKSSFRDAGNFFDEQVSRVTVPVWLVGGGYVERSGSTGLMIGLFYDLIQDPNSPYGRDFILRAGIFF
jgi:hypothetical protein